MKPSSYTPIQAYSSSNGLYGGIFLAAAFHVAVGGMMWVAGDMLGSRPPQPLPDIIMVQVVSAEPVEAPIVLPEKRPVEPTVETPVETLVETTEVIPEEPEELQIEEVLPKVEQEPELVLEPPAPEEIIEETPGFETPVRKPEPEVAQVVEPEPVKTPVVENPPSSPVSEPMEIQTASTEQSTGVVQQAITRISYAQNPKPAYPREARRKRQEGVVLLRVTVSPDGFPMTVHIQESSGYRLLDRAASKAVRTWKFIPATAGGTAVIGTVDVPIRFFLKDD